MTYESKLNKYATAISRLPKELRQDVANIVSQAYYDGEKEGYREGYEEGVDICTRRSFL